MKFALCNEMFLSWTYLRQFQFMADCGYDGVELAPFTLDPDMLDGRETVTNVARIDSSRRKAILKDADHAGIQISGLHWILSKTQGLGLTSPDREIRRQTANYLIALAQLCNDLGAEYMVFGSPQQRNLLPDVTKSLADEFAEEVLSQVLPTLEKCSVTLGLEPLTSPETNYLETIHETVSLLKKIGAPAPLTLHMDCKAMATGEKESPASLITNPENIPFLKTLHANDPNRQGPGFGQLDFLPIMKALKEIQFHGWIGVEPFDNSPGIEKLGINSLQYLKECLKNA